MEALPRSSLRFSFLTKPGDSCFDQLPDPGSPGLLSGRLHDVERAKHQSRIDHEYQTDSRLDSHDRIIENRLRLAY